MLNLPGAVGQQPAAIRRFHQTVGRLYVMWNLRAKTALARLRFHPFEIGGVGGLSGLFWVFRFFNVWWACPKRSPAEPKAGRLGRSGGEVQQTGGVRLLTTTAIG